MPLHAPLYISIPVHQSLGRPGDPLLVCRKINICDGTIFTKKVWYLPGHMQMCNSYMDGYWIVMDSHYGNKEMGRQFHELIDLRVQLVESVLQLKFNKFVHSLIHVVPHLLCTGDPLDSAHFAELNVFVHELCHALVQLNPERR